MEKLQAAIQKAREKRGYQPAPPPRNRPEANEPTKATGASLWEAVAPMTINPRRLERYRVVTNQAGAKATPFDILRTKVLLQMRQNGWTRLAVTSPMPSSGKTTVSCNLALGLGRQKGLRSILLDTDLRDPSVNRFFETEPNRSIGDVFSGDVDFVDQAMRIGDNILVSMAQKPETDPTRLLLAEETAEVIDGIEARLSPDVMIFDLPSLLVNDDTRAFLKNVDCALIVVRAGITKQNQFDICEREIGEHTNILGVVMNAYRFSDPGRSTE